MWFAWKIVLLQYRKQRRASAMWRNIGCDLLEKSYFCSIANNFNRFMPVSCRVVICLKNRTFAVSQTTGWKYRYCLFLLWFAWKIVLLQYRKQHLSPNVHCVRCCDLLEKSYFCSIANNEQYSRNVHAAVVICLKNRTFAVSQTTRPKARPHSCGLWFAWKIVLLQYRKQHTAVSVMKAFRLWFAWKIVLLQYRKQPL